MSGDAKKRVQKYTTSADSVTEVIITEPI